MSWIVWSEKSKEIPFKTNKTGEGDGELKVACELGTCNLGQNSPYDIEIEFDGIKKKYDVKKLDTQNDFNTGKEGRDALRRIKHLHTSLLDSVTELSANYSKMFTRDEITLLSQFHKVSPDELAVGTLNKLHNLCELLHHKEKTIRSTLPTIQFTSLSQTIDIPIDIYHGICKKIGLPFPTEHSHLEETIHILQKMEHVYILNPALFMSELDRLVENIFADVKLIIVDEEKGYMFMEDLTKIKFYRITRGNPRFKVVF